MLWDLGTLFLIFNWLFHALVNSYAYLKGGDSYRDGKVITHPIAIFYQAKFHLLFM